MLRRTWMIVALVSTAALIAGVAVVFAISPRTDVRVAASSSAKGTSPEALLPDAGDDEVWTSDGETVGAWVEINWSRPTDVDRVTIASAGGSAAFGSGTLVFDDGSSLLVTPADDGSVEVSFSDRTVSTARLTIASAADGADSVSLTDFALDDGGEGIASGEAMPTASSSSNADGVTPDQLTDGDVASGDTGLEWSPSPDDTEAAWVQLDWDEPRELASFQVFGPVEDAVDPAYSAASPLNGRLVFGDGSSVVVSGIDGGGGKPTTVAFMPRVATSVRLEIAKTISQAVVGIRGISAYDRGVTPPAWTSGGDTYSADPEAAAECSGASALDSDLTGITLLCPTPSSAVDGEAIIVVQSPDATQLEATGWVPGEGEAGEMRTLATASTDSDRIAEFTVDVTELPAGPVAIKIQAAGGLPSDSQRPLYVQLYNLSGRPLEEADDAPTGKTLQWADEFDQPLSVSYSGEGATYAATKPQYWGGSEFGDAVFDKPDSGNVTFSTMGDDYLRIRVLPLGDYTDEAGWDRRHTGGLMSSLDIGASGFSAQYGYYEARMLGAGGPGTWPAFWMLNTQSATKDDETFGEADAVELYGHDTSGSCHALHQWSPSGDDSDVECLQPNGYPDWAMTWHTYGVQITPNGADFYIDGDLVMSKTGLFRTEEPFYFLVNLELGGGWPVDLSGTQETADLYVDYIRVYS